MFRVPFQFSGSASFRLQLFTAPGQRSVAVVTQTMDEGPSLTNAAETCAAAVWKQHCPTEDQPPVWIQRQLLSGPPKPGSGLKLVTFGQAAPYELRAPSWKTISAGQLETLVCCPVDTDRGSGYVPAEPQPEPVQRFETMAVCRLARPTPFREPSCMPAGTPWWRRWLRQAVPTRRTRSCCWYHGGDWHQVNRMAISALAEATRANVAAEDMVDFAQERATAAGADPWQRQALDSLFSDPIEPAPDGYVNGQHRAEGMLDAGVRRTVVARWVYP